MAKEKQKDQGKTTANAEREERLAQALRANLKRRKTQMRERRVAAENDTDKSD